MPQKWMEDLRKMEYKEHRSRIKDMKPTVDNQEPHKMPFSQKAATERRLYAERVQKENRLVLDRIGKAMEGCRLNNGPPAYILPSLYGDNRRLFLQSITAENQRMLYRIQNVDPVYNRLHWERDALAKEHILRNMTQFPDLYVPHYLPTLHSHKKKNKANSIVEDLANNYIDASNSSNYNQDGIIGASFAESVLLQDSNGLLNSDNRGSRHFNLDVSSKNFDESQSESFSNRIDAFDGNASNEFLGHSNTNKNSNNSNKK